MLGKYWKLERYCTKKNKLFRNEFLGVVHLAVLRDLQSVLHFNRGTGIRVLRIHVYSSQSQLSCSRIALNINVIELSLKNSYI
jgi:hypothetical protein